MLPGVVQEMYKESIEDFIIPERVEAFRSCHQNSGFNLKWFNWPKDNLNNSNNK